MCSVDWWRIGNTKDYFDVPGDHAGELETSVMMHIHPEFLLPLEEAGKAVGRGFKIKGLKDGWVTSQRQWTKVTDDTGVGDPALSTAEKGKRFLEMTTREISEFLVEMEKADLDDLYEREESDS
jgi:creatinine amidohydrolase